MKNEEGMVCYEWSLGLRVGPSRTKEKEEKMKNGEVWVPPVSNLHVA